MNDLGICLLYTSGSSATITNYDIDYQGNVNLLREAQRAGVKHFTYISVIKADSDPKVPKMCIRDSLQRAPRLRLAAHIGKIQETVCRLRRIRRVRLWQNGRLARKVAHHVARGVHRVNAKALCCGCLLYTSTVSITLDGVDFAGLDPYVNGGVWGHGNEGTRNIADGTMTTQAVVNRVEIVVTNSKNIPLLGVGGGGSTKVNSGSLTVTDLSLIHISSAI